MAAGSTHNSHIDYDTLKGGKGSPGNVCKTEPAAPEFSIFVPDLLPQNIKEN